jgi:hypothetical protein
MLLASNNKFRQLRDYKMLKTASTSGECADADASLLPRSSLSFISLALACLRHTAHRHKGGQNMQTIRNNLLCKGRANQLSHSHNKHALALKTLATGAVWEEKRGGS